MTFCKILAETKKGNKAITAYEKTDKYNCLPEYEIVLSKNSIGYLVIKTAKTTWKRKYNELVKGL